jgi:hypothetical protein
MKLVFARLIVLAALLAAPAFSATAAFAQDHGGESGADEEHGSGGIDFLAGPDWDDAKEVTIWSIVSVATFGTVLGVLYLFKRKVGGFPEHPAWVAPISIMRASDLPGDGDDGHEAAAPHDSHAPAH